MELAHKSPFEIIMQHPLQLALRKIRDSSALRGRRINHIPGDGAGTREKEEEWGGGGGNSVPTGIQLHLHKDHGAPTNPSRWLPYFASLRVVSSLSDLFLQHCNIINNFHVYLFIYLLLYLPEHSSTSLQHFQTIR